MDPSSRSLLDLLSKSSTEKKSSDKDQLLALFGQPPPAEGPETTTTPPSTNRNSNANDLLAALMGSSAKKRHNEDKSADLLSSLMATSRSPYNNDATPGPQTASQSNEKNGASPSAYVSGSYVNPRHEYLSKSPAPSLPVNSGSNTKKKAPFFTNMNPFDELEAANDSRAESDTEGSQIPRTMTQHANEHQLNAAKARHVSALAGDTIPTNHEEVHSEPSTVPPMADNQDAPATSSNTKTTTMPKSSAVQVGGENSPAKVAYADRAIAVHLPGDTSSSFKLVGAPIAPQSLGEASPVTKMTLKYDALNRNIVAASRKYIAYQLAKENDIGLIRIVDQETGETSILSQHSSKVVNLTFAKSNDEDGKNALISTDTDSNVVVWSIASINSTDKVFEIAGPSDTSHKARAKWNQDGTYFGVAITSRIYVFDYRSLVSTQKSVKAKLHPEMKHVLCICKSEKAIRDYTFSLDNTSIAGIDKTGNIKLWNLESSGKTCSAVASITLGDRSLSSITFVGSRHVVVGLQATNSLLLVDIQAAKAVQELRLPGGKDGAMRTKTCYLAEAQLLVTDSVSTKTIYLIQLKLSDTAEQKTSGVISRLSPQSSHVDAVGQFRTVCELTTRDEITGEWFDYAGVTNQSCFDIYVAHTKGYTLYSPLKEGITALFADAQLLSGSNVSKMQNIGSLVLEDEIANKEEAPKGKIVPSDQERSTPTLNRTARKTAKLAEHSPSTAIVTEPRTAEIAAKIEANLKATLTVELQKSNASLRAQIEKLQSGNDTRHENVLRLVSETLSKNTTQVLKTSISDAIEKTILPTITDAIDKSVSANIRTNVRSALDSVLAKELSNATHSAVKSAFDAAGLVGQIQTATASMTNDFATRHKHMEQNLAGALVRMDAQILERQKADSDKIDNLLQCLKALEQQVARLSSSQAANANTLPAPSVPLPSLPTPNHNLALLQGRPPMPAAPHAAEDFSKYHDLIMDFVAKSQKIASGDFDGVPFIRQFLSWQPDIQVKEGICQSLGSDQLQLLAFVHALASELSEEDAFNRIHWIGSAVRFLAVKKDPRLETLGPQLLTVIRANITRALDRAPVGSHYKHLLEAVLGQIVQA